jgi:hypothetical protein
MILDASKLLGDFSQPHTTTEIMATIRSGDALAELGRISALGVRGSALIDPGASHMICTLDGNALVQVQLAPQADPAAAARWLAVYPNVLWTAPNKVFEGDATDLTPNDPQYGSQYHLPKMRLSTAWDTQTGDASIVLAICDLGTAYNHPDLAANIWTNADEIAGNAIDDDANGFVDDIRGWDFNVGDNDPNPAGTANHGTHTAGIAAALTNNAVGVSGIAGGDGTAGSGIRIMPLRWDGTNAWTAARVASTYTYAADNGAKIVSASYNFDGFASDPTVTAAFNYSYSLGVLHFNSAGNNNQNNPARRILTQALMVASTDANDVKSSFSNYGTFVDIAAPGSNILSTSATTNGTVFNYATISGTSMSTPAAAGVAALIWSEHPSWTREQVAAQLIATADNIDSINPGFVGWLGTGRANATRALTETIPAPKFGTITGLPAAGSNTFTAFTTFTITTSMRFDPATVVAANFELRGDGPDGTFGTADDVLLPLTINAGAPYRVGTDSLAFTFSTMNPDRYRFTARSGGLLNPFGLALDGDGNGVGGDDFVREFGFKLQVSGTSYEDWDANGVRGANDPILAGVTVFADLNDNGTREATEPYAVSDAAGVYAFGGLPIGNTVVRQVALSGYSTTGAPSQTVNLPTATSTAANVDFGEIRSEPAVYGRVFTDTNANGVPDAGESGQSGRVVYADVNNNGINDSGEAMTTTNTLGNYRIPLAAGAYPVRLDYLAGMGATAPVDNLYSVVVGVGPVTGKDYGQRADAVAPTGTVTVGTGPSRSRIESLTVTFSEVVTFNGNDPAAAFALTRTGGGTIALSAVAAIIDGHSVVTLTFLSGTQFGSLVDGRYVLNVDSSRIHDIALNELQPIAPTNFHRYFGDINGDANVDISDFGQFSSSYGLNSTQTGFIAGFDYNNDGVIDIADFGQFSVRVFTPLP